MKNKFCIVLLAVAWCFSSVSAQSKTVTLQQGLDGYSGCEDKELRNTEKNFGSGPKETNLLINEY